MDRTVGATGARKHQPPSSVACGQVAFTSCDLVPGTLLVSLIADPVTRLNDRCCWRGQWGRSVRAVHRADLDALRTGRAGDAGQAGKADGSGRAGRSRRPAARAADRPAAPCRPWGPQSLARAPCAQQASAGRAGDTLDALRAGRWSRRWSPRRPAVLDPCAPWRRRADGLGRTGRGDRVIDLVHQVAGLSG